MSQEALLDVLADTRSRLRQPSDGPQFLRADIARALVDVNEMIRRIEGADPVELLPLRLMFAPTGLLQDISIESGWGREFLALAARFDDAIGDL